MPDHSKTCRVRSEELRAEVLDPMGSGAVCSGITVGVLACLVTLLRRKIRT
ncbi:MAG: hypothetical protein ACAI44_17510 [Candidatus Sericytochromatia bacterium]